MIEQYLSVIQLSANKTSINQENDNKSSLYE